MHPANAPPIAPHCRSRNHQKSSREISRLFLQSYHVQYIPNTLKPSATSQSRRQNPAFFFPPRPKVKRSHKFPNSQTSLLWANESGSYPSYPSLKHQGPRPQSSDEQASKRPQTPPAQIPWSGDPSSQRDPLRNSPCLHNQDSQPPPPRSHRATNHK